MDSSWVWTPPDWASSGMGAVASRNAAKDFVMRRALEGRRPLVIGLFDEWSEQAHLGAFRRHEQVAAEGEFRLRKAVAGSRFGEARPKQLGPRPLALHPGEEIGVVVAPAAQAADGRHDLARPIREMLVEPGAEQWRHFMRQPNRQI